MGLTGRLEDMSLVEILQIVAFSQKTGYLQVGASAGTGAIAFKQGRVVCAHSPSTLKYLQRLGDRGFAPSQDESLIHEQINVSIRELAGLHEGEFHFELADTLTSELSGVDISSFLAFEGINPQHLLLDLSQEMDEQRRDAATMLEAMFDGGEERFDLLDDPYLTEHAVIEESGAEDPNRSPPVPEPPTVVIVDDDPNFIDSLVPKIRDAGYPASHAAGPAEGERLIAAAQEAGVVVAVVDQKMPTSSGRSFNGGFELVRRLKKREVAVVLMADGLSEDKKKRALKLGIRKVVYKPTLSQLDPEEYDADFDKFVAAVLERLREIVVQPPPRRDEVRSASSSESKDAKHGATTGFLSAMTEELLDRHRSSDISRMVLTAAARFFQRGVLFLVDGGQACGLGGFGLHASEKGSFAVARALRLSLADVEPFALVVSRRQTVRTALPDQRLGAALLDRIGRHRATECAMVPMLHNGDVLLILYGDNGADGRPVGALRELELFVRQAGMALENAFMQQKLASVDSRLGTRA